MKKQLDLRRYKNRTLIEFGAVLELLRRIHKHAPNVRSDLLKRVSSAHDAADVEKAVAEWCRTWHLCDADGPAAWAMMVGRDTADHVPEFGWNLRSYAPYSPVQSLPEGYMTDTGVDMSIHPVLLKWNPSRETPAKFRKRLCDVILDDVELQMDPAAEQYAHLLTPVRNVDPDRAFTFLLRYQVLGEYYSTIANHPLRYREQPDRRETYPLADVRRDIAEAARQAGLKLRFSRQGRPSSHH